MESLKLGKEIERKNSDEKLVSLSYNLFHVILSYIFP